MPASHALPHPPQWFWLIWVSTHAPSHIVWTSVQEAAHSPPAHFCPTEQRVSHDPQCWSSLAVSMQAPPQSACPAPHSPFPSVNWSKDEPSSEQAVVAGSISKGSARRLIDKRPRSF